MSAVLQCLQESAPCQRNQEGGDDEDDEGGHDNLVMDSVTDLIGVLAKVIGPNFVQYFDAFQKPLMKFAKPKRWPCK